MKKISNNKTTTCTLILLHEVWMDKKQTYKIEHILFNHRMQSLKLLLAKSFWQVSFDFYSVTLLSHNCLYNYIHVYWSY